MMKQDKLRVVIAGATGWAGTALARAVIEAEDLDLIAAVARQSSGKNLGEILGLSAQVPIYGNLKQALDNGCDVFVEYTKPNAALKHVLTALDTGADIVVGTSGLTDDDYSEIGAHADKLSRSVLAVGNFSVTAVLLQKFATMAARWIPQCEIIDYASDKKADAPSGTARELSHKLGKVRASQLTIPLAEVEGEIRSRGAKMSGQQVHALRLPGYTLTVEAIFGLPDERLVIRHEAGSSATPYVAGAMMAIRKVSTFTGLRRGLDSVMEFE